MTPGFSVRRRGGLLRWAWTATGGTGPGAPAVRQGRAWTAVRAERAGWRTHRALLGLPRIAANQVPQP